MFRSASFSVPVVNLATGSTGEQVELKSNIFGARVRPDLLHQMVVWHLANKRRGLANVCDLRFRDSPRFLMFSMLIAVFRAFSSECVDERSW